MYKADDDNERSSYMLRNRKKSGCVWFVSIRIAHWNAGTPDVKVKSSVAKEVLEHFKRAHHNSTSWGNLRNAWACTFEQTPYPFVPDNILQNLPRTAVVNYIL